MGEEFEWGYMKREQVKAFRENLKKNQKFGQGRQGGGRSTVLAFGDLARATWNLTPETFHILQTQMVC